MPSGHSPQGLDVEGNYQYQAIYDNDLAYGVPGLDICNVSNPYAFSQAGTAILSGTCHARDVAVEASTAYVARYTNSSLAVVDVSNPASPTVNRYISLPANSYPIFLEAKGRYVYSISNTKGGMLSVIDSGQRTTVLIGRREAAEMLSISCRALDYLVANKQISFRRIASGVLISVSDSQRFARTDPQRLAG